MLRDCCTFAVGVGRGWVDRIVDRDFQSPATAMTERCSLPAHTLGHLQCKWSPMNERVQKTAVQIRHRRHESRMQR